jgi:hypothetical protein
MVERSEFELPVPLSKLSDNSLMLSFATSRRVVKRSPPWTAFVARFILSLKRTVPNWIALSGRSSRGVASEDDHLETVEKSKHAAPYGHLIIELAQCIASDDLRLKEK